MFISDKDLKFGVMRLSKRSYQDVHEMQTMTLFEITLTYSTSRE